MSSVRIIHSCSDFIVVAKSSGVHSAPLQAGDTTSALALVAKKHPEVLNVRGKKSVEGGLVHRIDYDTTGLLLFACNQKFYDHIVACQDAGLFKKNYLAYCNFTPKCSELLGGYPPSPDFSEKIISGEKITVSSGFRPFGPGRREVRPVTDDSGKFSKKKAGDGRHSYTTSMSIFKNEQNYKVEASITKGYRHQVRCHLAWCSLPIIGDSLYNPSSKITQGDCNKGSSQMEFFAIGFSFPSMDFSLEKNCPFNREELFLSTEFHSFSLTQEDLLKIKKV